MCLLPPLNDPRPAPVFLRSSVPRFLVCIFSSLFFLKSVVGRNVSDNPLFPFSGLAQLRGRRCLPHTSTPSAACGAFWGSCTCAPYSVGAWEGVGDLS